MQNLQIAGQGAGARLLTDTEIHAVSGGVMDDDATILLAITIYSFAVGGLFGIARGIWDAIWG